MVCVILYFLIYNFSPKTALQGEGRGQFFTKFALRNISMAPKLGVLCPYALPSYIPPSPDTHYESLPSLPPHGRRYSFDSYLLSTYKTSRFSIEILIEIGNMKIHKCNITPSFLSYVKLYNKWKNFLKRSFETRN